MAIQVQLRRGDATENDDFTGAIGELSFDTTNNQVRIHDGSTQGGFKIGVGDFPTGTNNVALGNTALDNLDGVSPGGNNTAVGHDALTANTTASFNTAIGVSAGSLITTGQKNTIVGSFDGNEGGLDIRTSNNHIVLSDGDGNPRLIIDNNGNVDIGDATTELKLKNTTHEDTDGGRESKITFQGEQSGGEQSVLAQIQASHDGASDDEKGDLIFRTNDGSDGSSPTEAARIDSDQNLLVGLSAVQSTGTAVGFQVASGTVGSTADASPAGIFARKTSDGDIIKFRKNTTEVGSIGTETSNSDLYIGNGDTAIMFHDGTDTIFPHNASTNASRDAAIDIGYSTYRFKDLYLSGGAYLGGTAAANKLDDYEEGTWTPVVGGYDATGNGYYTKVGNLVSFHADFTTNASATTTQIIGGLPFVPNGAHSAWHVGYTDSGAVGGYVDNTSQTLYSIVAGGTAARTIAANQRVICMGFYSTNA